MDNPLKRLNEFGQSPWLDYISRPLLRGPLEKMIEVDGLRGMTSNPAIFEKSIGESSDYDSEIQAMALQGLETDQIYDELSVKDVQTAADQFQGVFAQTHGLDGYVSLEVSPYLARDTQGTVDEARRLWKQVGRQNVMIKVPGTKEGLPAIEQLISEGININVTLLFSVERYREVAEAYVAGLKKRHMRGEPVEIASVASFFLSRIDTMIDPMLDKVSQERPDRAKVAESLKGKIAIASARLAYQVYKEVFGSAEFAKLAEAGAKVQRLLWASTSTKNPDYEDTLYVETLVGPETVNTMPMETIEAYRDHGNPASRIEEGVDEAREQVRLLGELGIDLEKVCQQLEDEGIVKFEQPFKKLFDSIEVKRQGALKSPIDPQRFETDAASQVEVALQSLQSEEFLRGMWEHNAALWVSPEDKDATKVVSNSLGWLKAPSEMINRQAELASFVAELVGKGVKRVVLAGMGGSSLAPYVFANCFPNQGPIRVQVLDLTNPRQVRNIENGATYEESYFLIASKSGTTAEPAAFLDYFWSRAQEELGDEAKSRFGVITDPGSELEALAHREGFSRVFLNFPDVGGRYSALTYFGLVPAAAQGIPVGTLLDKALRMASANGPERAVASASGVVLGAVLGVYANQGRNKLTFVLSDAISTMGLWLEQLVAESTGKEGEGILPIATEPLANPNCYGDDRVFIHMVLDGDPEEQDVNAHMNTLHEMGHPVIRIRLYDLTDLAQEFFRWEVAIATAGKVVGINPFDQPNVQEAKDTTKRLLQEFEKTGQLPERGKYSEFGPLKIYDSSGADAVDIMRGFLAMAQPDDYIATLCFSPDSPLANDMLERARKRILESTGMATTLGFGPRYLHSTGQYHKGGPNQGLFIVLGGEFGEDVALPNRNYGFSVFEKAQMLGDIETLKQHERRVLPIDLGDRLEEGLRAYNELIEKATEG